MGMWKVLGGVALGVGAVAAAPFTGRGSILGPVSLAGLIATVADVAGGGVGSMFSDDESNSSNNSINKDHILFNKLTLSSKEREGFIILLTSFGIAVANSDGKICNSELSEINKFNYEIQKSKLSDSCKNHVSHIIDNKGDLTDFLIIFEVFIKNKNEEFILNTFSILDKVLNIIIYADGIIAEEELLFKKKWQLYVNTLKNNTIIKPNILIVGGTGVGKSSLINLLFHEYLAEVGEGKPIRNGIKQYGSLTNNDYKVVAFDSDGLELKKENLFFKTIDDFLRLTQKSISSKRIHVIWHVIDSSSNRITDHDNKIKEFIKQFEIPVAEVLTKADLVDEDDLDSLVKELYSFSNFKKAFDNMEPPFFVTNKKEVVKQEYNLNINKVMSWTYNKIEN